MKIEGIEQIKAKISQDNRGVSKKILENGSETFAVDDVFISISNKNVIRGMHFQPKPFGQKKRISVIEGRIQGVVLDLRENSNTFKQFQEIVLSDKDDYVLSIPEYCAWGFRGLDDINIVTYCICGKYQKERDLGIRWDSFGYDWGIDCPIMNDRDRRQITLDEYLGAFL